MPYKNPENASGNGNTASNGTQGGRCPERCLEGRCRNCWFGARRSGFGLLVAWAIVLRTYRSALVLQLPRRLLDGEC